MKQNRILIVDDIQSNLTVLQMLLQRAGYRVHVAGNGKLAMEILRQESIDLIISDILMPVMDGYELCRQCRLDESLSGIPLIFYTATYTTDDDRAFGLNLGAARFIIKPAEHKALLSEIAEVLAEAREQKRPVAADPSQLSETVYERGHNIRLVHKLEQKLEQLEQLEHANSLLQQQMAEDERLQQVLAASEKQLRFITDHAPVMIAQCDKEKRYTFVNQSYAEIFGMQPHELNGKYAKDILGDQAFADASPHMDIALSGRDSVYDLKLPTTATGPNVVSVHYSPERDDSGRVVGFIAAISDITARKQAEQNLVASEAKYKTVFDASTDAMMIMGEKGFLDVNESTLNIFGCRSRQDFLNRHPAEFSPPLQPCGTDSLSLSNAHMMDAYKHGSNHFEWMHQRMDGTVFPADVLITRTELNGEVVLMATVRDITTAKQNTDTIQQQLTEISKLYHTAPCGYHSLDRDGVFTHINDTELAWLGYARDEIIGKKKLPDLQTPHGRATFQQNFPAFKKRGKVENLEFEFIRKDGSIFVGLLSSIAEKDEAGQYLSCQSTVVDITQRKLQEQFNEDQRHILEQVADSAVPLADVLGALVQAIQAQRPHMIASILLLAADGKHLQHGAAPDLPDAYNRVIDNVAIGPCVGSCGTAAFRGERVIVADIASDPLWADYKELALGHGLAACWSEPVKDAKGHVLGTFAMYYRQPKAPENNDLELIRRAAALAANAIEHKQAESRLMDSNNNLAATASLLQNIITSIPSRVFWKDRDSRLMGCNTLFAQDAGFSGPEEIIGKTDAEMGWSEQADLYRADDQAVMASGAAKLAYEEPQTTPAGDTIWLRTSKVPLRDEHDAVNGVLGVYEDITEQKATEALIINSERQLRQVLNAEFDAVIVHQGEHVVYTNHAAQQLFGFTSLDGTIGKSVLDFVASPQYRRRLVKAMKYVMKTGRSVERTEVQALRPDSGEVFPIEIGSAGVMWADEPAVVTTVRDISGRKQAEEELRKHREHLEELVDERTHELAEANTHLKDLDRLKSMFIASMSHELRTPMNSILGFTGLILDGMTGEINATQRDQLQRVNNAGHHLLTLISDVIDISKVEAGKVVTMPVPFTLDTLLQEAIKTTQFDLEQKGLSFKPDLPAAIAMFTDRQRLLQCVLNLLSNAIKYSKQGQVELRAQQQDDEVLIEVADSGIGMTEDEIKLLFKPFVRLDSELAVTAGGTGLGLYLTRKLMQEVLGGSISVSSQPGVGSCFTLRLPCKLPPVQTDSEHTQGDGL